MTAVQGGVASSHQQAWRRCAFARERARRLSYDCCVGNDTEDPGGSADAEREQAALFRHRLSFLLALVVTVAGLVLGGFVGTIALLVSAAMLAYSGVAAVVARRHMFGAMVGSAWGPQAMRSAERSATSSTIVGSILVVLGLALAALAILRGFDRP